MKRKTFSVINIGGLAVGMAAALLILNYVSHEYSYDKHHPNLERLFRVESQFYEGKVLTADLATSTYGYGPAMIEELSGLEDICRITCHGTERVVSYGDVRFREESVCYTEPSFFDFFSFPLLEGDRNSALNHPNTVVLTERVAQRYFKGEDPLGKILTFKTSSETINCEVTGILRDLPSNTHLDFDFFVSFETLPTWIRNFWYLHEIYTYVRLSPGTEPKSIEDQFPALAEKYKTTEALKNKIWAISLVPIEEIHLNPKKSYEREIKGNRMAIHALIIIAFSILIIAWINYINLTIAKSMERAKEVGVRKVNGAQVKMLIGQFLLESLIINGIALCIAFLLMVVGMPFFSKLVGKSVSLIILGQPFFWSVLIGVFLAGIIFSGLYPAFILSRVRPITVLKGRYVTSRAVGHVRKGLVVVQFLASFLLIAGTVIIYNQVEFMRNQPLGVQVDRTMVVKYPAHVEKQAEKMNSFKRNLKKKIQVKSVTLSASVPGLEIAKLYSNYLYNSPVKEGRLYEMLSVDYDFISSFGLEVLAGRAFDESYSDDVNKLVLNEEALKYLEIASPEEAIGKRVTVETMKDPMEIIGVVRNWHQQSLQKSYPPIMFFLSPKIPWIPPIYVSVHFRGGLDPGMVEQIREEWSSFFPDSTFDYFFLDSFFEKQYQEDRRFGNVFALLALLAIFIACMGLWALALYACSVRTKEIGVRKVLGASDGSVIQTLGKEFLQLVILSILIGIPLSWWVMNHWLQGYAFHVSISIVFFVLPVLLVVIIALGTLSYHVLRTARRNPVESLRYE